MPDMIPASKVAAAALRQIKDAQECFPKTYHDTEKSVKAGVHLQVAYELLTLIAEPANPLVTVTGDAGVMFLAAPPSPDPAPEDTI